MNDDNPGTASDWVDIDAKTRRRILAHTGEMMVVEVQFQPGGCGVPHAHPHLQAAYVKEGSFAFTIAGQTRVTDAGESVVIPSDAVHSCESATGGSLIDVFTPARDDFLTG